MAFVYPNGEGDRDSFRLVDVSFRVKPDEVLAIMGQSGAGKTTLIINFRIAIGTISGMTCSMRTKGSAEALEMRRMIGGKMLQEGRGVREVSRLLGVSPSTVSRWKQDLEAGGVEALRAKPHPGRAPKLTAKQKLERILLKGAQAAGFPTDLWTLERVGRVIEREFGVRYHPRYVWHILIGMGGSAQKPERRARERDEEAIAAWRTEGWAKVKKSPVTMAGLSCG